MKQHMEYVLRLFISENCELHRKKKHIHPLLLDTPVH